MRNSGQGATPAALLAAAGQAMGPVEYRERLARLVAEGRTTGPDQGAEMVAYTKLNLSRTARVEKTVRIGEELRNALRSAPAMTWLVITEPWCGDSSQLLPVLQLMAQEAPQIALRILLRDEHPALIDRYLTAGARGIPKLIAFDAEGRERFTWGPRPATAHALVMENKKLPAGQQLPKEAIYAKVHAWYAADRGQETQAELLGLLRTGSSN
jgi:hypothetical protein